jgi:hypothetical protein
MNCHHGFASDMKCGYCCYEDIFDRRITVNINDLKSRMVIHGNPSIESTHSDAHSKG